MSTLREAGFLEQYYNVRSRTELNSYVFSVVRYEHPSGSPLTKDVLYHALSTVILSIPELSAQLPAPPAPPMWTRMSSIDLDAVVTFIPDAATDATLQHELEARISMPILIRDDVPRWRLFVYADGTIAFAYDHVIADGQSGPAFHRALLSALSSTPTPATPANIVKIPDAAMPALTPALEVAMDASVPLLTLLHTIFFIIFPFLDFKKRSAWTGNPIPPARELACRVRILRVSPADVAALLALARAHGTTLTGALHALAILVLSRLVHASGAGARATSLPTCVAVSLRAHTRAPSAALCNHISPHLERTPLAPAALAAAPVSARTFPWAEAARLTRGLRGGGAGVVAGVGLLKYVHPKYEGLLTGSLGKPRGEALELSNLGAFPKGSTGTEDGGWRIRDLLFVQANATLGAAVKVNVASSPDGAMGVTVTWGKGAIEDEFGEEFASGFSAGLEALLGAEK
ncbi:alcohol acetyltransferase-domain-containing protein [Epithele typhae]|uniref:alcohol acetyltransferase-domain-containing protein n=1 Tax=Epithele typhae TaxID=378194 RepID=UPI00200742BF|nr:alcohol acetyltransferase-domain-containing protein [Epithele typhae]KAH9936773.1 alcohol acetyltransferase-domain-containing protein [Epithele typhae]